MKSDSEKKIESVFQNRCNDAKLRIMCMKQTGQIGVPDRQILYKGKTFYVECKSTGDKPRQIQKIIMQEMANTGANVFVIDTIHGANRLIDEIINFAHSDYCRIRSQYE